jgi:aldose 1-epimerase
MEPVRSEFGHLADGRVVEAWRIGSERLTATILNYGARIAAIEVTRGTQQRNVVLGCPTMAEYIADRAAMGAICGRYANRIAGGRFALDGRTITLPRNAGGNTLHGGPLGFQYLLWNAVGDGEAVRLDLTSPDGDMGFPGRLEATVRYSVGGGTLAIDYSATTDAPTVLNLTNHAYFNLAGKGDVLGHLLTIPATHFTPVHPVLIPTGELREVAGTPFDFRTSMAIGARIHAEDEQLHIGGGYDHNYVLGEEPSETPQLAARLEAGRIALEVRTTEPGLQLYTGNSLGPPFGRHGGLCLETQHFPDSPNHPDFPSTVLRPGETFRSRTEFHFSTSS